MTLARDPIPFLEDDTDAPFHQLKAAAEKLSHDRGRQQYECKVEIPGLVEMRALTDRKRCNGREPLLTAVSCLHLEGVVAGREPAIAR